MASSTSSEVRSDKILLEIVTPRGIAMSAVVDEVTAPSVKGEFGVLPGHLPLLVALQTGLVSFRVGADTTRVAVGRGFAETGANKVLILTDEYVERSKVDPVLVRKELGEIQAQLDRGEGTEGDAAEKRVLLIQRENWLAAQLELYGDPPPATMRPFEQFGPPPLAEDEEYVADDGTNAGS